MEEDHSQKSHENIDWSVWLRESTERLRGLNIIGHNLTWLLGMWERLQRLLGSLPHLDFLHKNIEGLKKLWRCQPRLRHINVSEQGVGGWLTPMGLKYIRKCRL